MRTLDDPVPQVSLLRAQLHVHVVQRNEIDVREFFQSATSTSKNQNRVRDHARVFRLHLVARLESHESDTGCSRATTATVRSNDRCSGASEHYPTHG